MDRAKVKSWTRAAQATLALAMLFAAGVGLAGFPGSTLPAAPEPVAPPAAEPGVTKPAAPAVEVVTVDVPDVAVRLGQLGNHPKPIEVVAAAPGTEVAPPPPTPELKYLGPIGIGDRRLALLVVAGKQVILGVGDTVPGGDHKIRDINELEVDIDDGAAGKKVERANKSAIAVTQIVNTAAPAAKPNANPGETQMNENMRDKIRAARDRRAALRGQRGQRQPGDPEQAEQNPGDAPR